VPGVELENPLVHAGRPVRRADVLGENARPLRQQVDATGVVPRHARVLLVQLVELLPLAESLVVPRQLGERGVVLRVDREHLLEALGGAPVVQELLVVQRRHALVEVDLLPRRRRDLCLALEVFEQLAVLAGAVVDTVQPLERLKLVRVDREDGFEAALRFTEVPQLIFISFSDLEQRRGPVRTSASLGAALEDADQRLVVPRPLGDTSHPVARLDVPRVFREDLRKYFPGARRVV
jgi:hypothetical protein